MKENILEMIKESAAVPSMPQVVSRFLEIMRDPGFEGRDLVKVLSTDAGTVSEVLRLANSALFGVRNKVVSLQQALTLLGPKRTRSLLLGRYLVDSMSKKRIAGLDMAYFWQRSLAASLIASQFAEVLLPHRRDEASIGALLADIGIPILAEALPEGYRPIVTEFKPRGKPKSGEEELETIEVTHGQVSAMVLAHWKLPEDVTNAVNLHQSSNPGDGDVATIARVLHASDKISTLLCELPEAEEVTTVCSEATAFIGVDVGILVRLLSTIESDIEEVADALRIDVIPSKVYELVAQTVQEQLTAPAAS